MNLLGNPTVEFCEKAGLGLIKRPFYALSNLVYLFVGLIILKQGKGSKLSKAFAYTAISIGLFSFVYDASYTYISQLVDLLGMFLFVHLVIHFSAKRYFAISIKRLISIQAFSILLGLFFVIYFKSFAGEFVFGTFIIFAIFLEFLLWKNNKTVNIKLYIEALAVFILGFIVWFPDASGLLCDPTNHINGRSIFHLLTSITIYMLYEYYSLQEKKSYDNVGDNKNLVEVLKRNGVVVMPTDTIYGLVGSALNSGVVKRIYNIRRRAGDKPCIILIGDIKELEKFSINLSDNQKIVIKKYWPFDNIQNFQASPTSIVLDCPEGLFEYLHRGTQTLAFRLPIDISLKELLKKVGPLIAPSANVENSPVAKNISEARNYFNEQVDLYVDGGEIAGKPSKLIKLHKDGSVTILRE